MPKFSIITPSLQRQSLVQCCDSVNSQILTDGWEHIVMVDCEEANYNLWDKIEHFERKILWCVEPHKNFGNTCRHNAWEFAMGTYVIYLDDDNHLAHPRALESIASALESAGSPSVAIFPILRHGRRFFNDPPGLCQTDTANFVLRREIAQWPDGPEYTMDGIFIERLRDQYGYVSFPDVDPIVVVPVSSEGK